ncbi:MAG: (Fe-S)-binding protein [Fimbriimonadales bacterium]
MSIERRDLQKCIHCGLCLQACPTYVSTGEEAESPRGRIYLMRQAVEGHLRWEAVQPHIDACMGCLGCQTACPSGVPYAQLIEGARAKVERHARTPFQRWMRQQAIRNFTNPTRLRWMLRMGRLLGMRSAPRWLVRGLGAPESAVRLPKLPPQRFVPQSVYPAVANPPKARVGLLAGCVMSVLFGAVHEATLRLLTLAGYEVHVPNAGCCGALWVHNGYPERASQHAHRLIQAFQAMDFVAVNAAGCGSTMKEYHHHLLAHTPIAKEAEAFSAKVRDISELLAQSDLAEPTRPLNLRVTVHDACHLIHGQGIREQPRDLLKRIPGLEIIEMEGAEMCCGSAGIYNLLQPQLAKASLQRKVEAIRQTGAQIVVSANPGCTLWIAQGLHEASLPIEVLHPVELLARAYA